MTLALQKRGVAEQDRDSTEPRLSLTLAALKNAFGAMNDETATLFSQDLAPIALRRSLVAQHPMLDAAYFIETENADRFYEVVFDHILARKSGLYCVGKYRIGKSKAIENSIERFRHDFPFMAFLRYDGERKPHQQKERFCADLLDSWHYVRQRGQSAERTLECFLMNQAALAGGRVCVVFIDEAQMWGVTHFRYLLEIWNALRRHGFLLVTVLVGQPSLDNLVTLTQELDHGAVVSRFFVKRHQMSGLQSVSGLQKYLEAYDSKLRFPFGSEWPYTRFFLQKAYDGGFRLGELSASELWPILTEEMKPVAKGRLKVDGVGLALITDTIHAFLLDAMRHDSAKFISTPERWRDALLAASDKESL